MIIENDLIGNAKSNRNIPVSIVDLGCGVGHGSHFLARIKNSEVTGIDVSPESLEYAQIHYCSDNITYQQADLIEYINSMPEFDYVVSRGVLEHVPNGIQHILSSKWTSRLIFDVPYDEKEGNNPHHLITGIREKDFEGFPGAELFFQDLCGKIYNYEDKPSTPNMIICACRNREKPPLNNHNIKFPIQPAKTR
jgi:SAM-dependent methyltransferase